MLNLPQGQRPVEVRTVRGSQSGEISQMNAQPILPPERVGPLILVPDSLIIADDYVHPQVGVLIACLAEIQRCLGSHIVSIVGMQR